MNTLFILCWWMCYTKEELRVLVNLAEVLLLARKSILRCWLGFREGRDCCKCW